MSDIRMEAYRENCPAAFLEMAEMRGQKTGKDQQIIGAYIGEEPAGTVLLSRDEGALNIEWIFVEPSFRRKGVGRSLLDFSLKTIEFKDERALPFVAAFPVSMDGGEAFFSQTGFEIFHRSALISIPISAFYPPAPFERKTSVRGKYEGVCMEQVAISILKEKDAELDFPDCDRDISFVCVDSAGKEQALLFAKHVGKNKTFISYLESDADDQVSVLVLLRMLYDKLRELRVADDHEISFLAENDSIFPFVKKLVIGEDSVKEIDESILAVRLLRKE